MTCWFCDQDLSEADAPGILVAQHGIEVIACSNCGGDPG